MSAFATAIGQLAQNYGDAGQIRDQQKQQALENQRQATLLQLSRNQDSRAQAELTLRQAEARKPIPLGKPYSANGKTYQRYWDAMQGKVVEMEDPGDDPLAALRNLLGREPSSAEREVYAGVRRPEEPTKPTPPKYGTEKQIRDPQSPTGWSWESTDENTGKQVLVKGAPDPYRSKAAGAGGGEGSDGIIDLYASSLANGRMTQDQIDKVFSGKEGLPTRQKIVTKAIGLGWTPTQQLSGPAQNVLMQTTPVIQQVDKLLGDIDNLKLGTNNTRGYLALQRLNYAFGGASPEGSLANDIAGLSLGSVVEAASALKGSSRSVFALKKALEHTPNPWVDSPQLIREKLTTIRSRLQDVVNDANTYGSKSGLANTAPLPGIGGNNASDPLGVLP